MVDINNMEHRHLKIVRYLMLFLGVWPLELTFLLSNLYSAYFYICYTYFVLFEASQIIKVYQVIGINWEEVFVNLGVVLTYVLSMFKVYFIRGPNIQKLIKKIPEFEAYLDDLGDEEVKAVYNEWADVAVRSGVIYVGVGTWCILMYFANPIVNDFIANWHYEGNVTLPRSLIFSSWFPFDKDENYMIAYIIQLFGGVLGYAYTVYSDAIFFTVFIFVVGQLKILQHYFMNIHEYSIKHREKSGIASDEQAELEFCEKLIFDHRDIISYVEGLDYTLRSFMLFEFLIASLKISMLILQILKSATLEFGTITVVSYVLTMILELYYFYWNANEIIIESSEGMTTSIFYGSWYKLTEKVKKNMVLIILRTKKPSKISIGPFYVMTIQAATSILKACYYYVALIQNTSEPDAKK